MLKTKASLPTNLDDLEQALNEGRNLLTEKYARMMEFTQAANHMHITRFLPLLDSEVQTLIDKIVEILLGWQIELTKKYPHIVARGRPIYSSKDTPSVTSVETYLRGELATYSKITLGLYCEYLLHEKAQNINGSEVILNYILEEYGYSSLEEADERLRTTGASPWE